MTKAPQKGGVRHRGSLEGAPPSWLPGLQAGGRQQGREQVLVRCVLIPQRASAGTGQRQREAEGHLSDFLPGVYAGLSGSRCPLLRGLESHFHVTMGEIVLLMTYEGDAFMKHFENKIPGTKIRREGRCLVKNLAMVCASCG